MMAVFSNKINPIEYSYGGYAVFTDEWSLGCTQMNAMAVALDGNTMQRQSDAKGMTPRVRNGWITMPLLQEIDLL